MFFKETEKKKTLEVDPFTLDGFAWCEFICEDKDENAEEDILQDVMGVLSCSWNWDLPE